MIDAQYLALRAAPYAITALAVGAGLYYAWTAWERALERAASMGGPGWAR